LSATQIIDKKLGLSNCKLPRAKARAIYDLCVRVAQKTVEAVRVQDFVDQHIGRGTDISPRAYDALEQRV
jgi:hypothetical protein